MFRKGILLFLILMGMASVHAEGGDLFPLGYSSHALIKQRIRDGDRVLQNEVKNLVSDADKILLLRPPSVMDDSTTTDGRDPHDYVSYAPYWWPDPEKPDGLPYIRRDGHVNTELRSKGDEKAFVTMANSVFILALAWFYTEEEKYAAHAEKFLSTWFLDPSTCMSPHAEGGQVIPGLHNSGRRAGINEMRYLTDVIDAVNLLEKSGSWKEAKHAALKLWYSRYFEWLGNSEYGGQERARPNNHGTWYDVQYVSIALFLGKEDSARQLLRDYSMERIQSQIDTTGKQPLEVSRGFSLHYSLYNIKAFFALATLAEKLGIDLWNYRPMNHSGIQGALDYVIPYINHQKMWPHDDLGRELEKSWEVLLSQAVLHYGEKKYSDALKLAEETNAGACGYCYRLVVPGR